MTFFDFIIPPFRYLKRRKSSINENFIGEDLGQLFYTQSKLEAIPMSLNIVIIKVITLWNIHPSNRITTN